MTVKTDVSTGGVAQIIIDRPEKRNAINSEIMRGLERCASELAQDPDIRAVVLCAAGDKVFSAGADLTELSSLNKDTARDFIDGLRRAIDAVYNIPVPVICRLQGPCIGGAMELAAACDLRIAAETATFCMPEVRVGIPSVIQAAMLPRLMGSGRANWLVLSGDVIDARRAFDWGFVEMLVPSDGLDTTVEKACASILDSAPEAVRAQKRLCRSWDTLPLQDAVIASVDAFVEAYETTEPQDYMSKIIRRT